jgi:hypothetical protein
MEKRHNEKQISRNENMSTDLKKKKSQSATLESPGLSLRNSSTQ